MFSKARLRRHGRGQFSREDGVALVEFALVLPFLLVIIFGMVDLGKAVSYWNDETHLANQASRYAAVNSCSACGGSTINSYILTQAETQELANNANVTIGFTDASGKLPGDTGYNSSNPPATANHCVGDPVRVRITYTYNLLSFVSNAIHLASVPINAESTMRLEKDYAGSGDKYTAVDASTASC
jgi:Flp pilus assembly protein TadG